MRAGGQRSEEALCLHLQETEAPMLAALTPPSERSYYTSLVLAEIRPSAEIKGRIYFFYYLYSHLQLGHWLSSSIDWTMANRSCIGLWESVRRYCSQLVLIGLSVQLRSKL